MNLTSGLEASSVAFYATLAGIMGLSFSTGLALLKTTHITSRARTIISNLEEFKVNEARERLPD